MRHVYFFVIFLFFTSEVFASEFTPKGPLNLRNQNPIYLQFLNIDPTRPVTLPKGQFSARVGNAYSNTFERGFGRNGTELLLDMESLRTSLNIDAGVYNGMEVGLEIPFLRFDTGFLDDFLQDYHNAFGFPNSGRERVPNESYSYRLSQGGTDIYNIASQENFGIGDITLHFKHNFWEERNLRPAVAWLFYLKAPTGSLQQGTSSGEPDFGLGAALEKNYRRWHGYLNLAYFINGGHEPLRDYIYDVYFSYVVGGEFSVSRPVSIVAQVNGGSPILKGLGMKQWDWVPLDLQVGIKGEHILYNSENLFWQLGFSEDLNADGPSVDLTVLGSIGIKFGPF